MTSVGEPFGLEETLQRRSRLFRRLRIVTVGVVIGWFLLPYDIQAFIPVWLPFLAALWLEAEFFIGGWRISRRAGPHRPPAQDRGPQPRDLADFGGEQWRDALVVDYGGEQHLVPSGGLAGDELEEHLQAYLADPDAALAAQAAAQPRPRTAPPGLMARHPLASRIVEAVLILAVVGGILLYASRPHGWDAVSSADRARATAAFSHQASRIAGHPARVACDTSGRYVGAVEEADGLAVVGGKQAWLTPGICDALYQLDFKHRTHSFSRTARALAVLAHESWHLEGVANEGIANCYAFQSGVQLGVNFGLSDHTAYSMMREQLATNASDSAGDPRYLVPPGCRDGGTLDLHPDSSRFP